MTGSNKSVLADDTGETVINESFYSSSLDEDLP